MLGITACGVGALAIHWQPGCGALTVCGMGWGLAGPVVCAALAARHGRLTGRTWLAILGGYAMNMLVFWTYAYVLVACFGL